MIRCMGCMQSYPEPGKVCPHCGYHKGTPAREAYHLAPESILQGRYIVGRVLGYGGFGVTYIGYDAQLDRVVAIREFLPTTFATRMPGGSAVTVYAGTATTQFDFGLDRFVQEAQRLAQFNGTPGITDIYDTFSGNNTAYIVMEYLKGRDVKDLLSANGPLPYEQARDIVLRVCDTLAPVHARGVIHRDISPDNIYLTDAGEVKLLDFGAARDETRLNSKSLSVILKPGYAPEEQYRSKGDQGPWTDVYALAATFYKMLTGATPPDSMERAIQDDLQEPSKLGVPLPQSAENALLNALNVRKADRTQSMADFKAALLADGVERVKAKPGAGAGAGFPLWGKISLAAAGMLLVVLAVLGGTGNLGGVGGRVLEDSFGNPIAEGNVGVPALAGKTQAEAQKLLEDAGLVMELAPSRYSDTGEKGLVLTQEPLSGRQIEEGGTVKVTQNGGSIEQAMADGDIPDLVGMDAVASVGFIHSVLGEDYYGDYRYDYSDTIPAGSITRFEREPGNSYLILYISAGPDDASPPYGELRAPLLFGFHSSLTTVYSIASVTPRQSGDETNYNAELTFSAAKEGGNWQPIFETYTDYWMSEEDIARGAPYRSSDYFVERLLASHMDLVGAPLQLRLEREVTQSEGGGVIKSDSLQFSQTFEIQLGENDLVIDSAEDIGWDGVQQLLDDGTIPADHHMRDNLMEQYYSDNMDDEQREYIRPILFKGNFSSNNTYNTILIEGQDYSEDGITYSDGMMLYFDHRMSNSGLSQLKLKIYPDQGVENVTFSEDGSHAVLVVPTPVEYTLANSAISPEQVQALADAKLDDAKAEEMARAEAEAGGAPAVSVDSTQAEEPGWFHSMDLSVTYGAYDFLHGILAFSIDEGDWVVADE